MPLTFGEKVGAVIVGLIVAGIIVAVAWIIVQATTGGDSRPAAATPAGASGDVQVYRLPDSRQVVCIHVNRGGYGEAISCDWDHTTGGGAR